MATTPLCLLPIYTSTKSSLICTRGWSGCPIFEWGWKYMISLQLTFSARFEPLRHRVMTRNTKLFDFYDTKTENTFWSSVGQILARYSAVKLFAVQKSRLLRSKAAAQQPSTMLVLLTQGDFFYMSTNVASLEALSLDFCLIKNLAFFDCYTVTKDLHKLLNM